MRLPVEVHNAAGSIVTVQFECVVSKKGAVIGPGRLEAVNMCRNFRGNAPAEAARTEYFDARLAPGRIYGQAIGKSPAGIDPDLPGGCRGISQNNGFISI